MRLSLQILIPVRVKRIAAICLSLNLPIAGAQLVLHAPQPPSAQSSVVAALTATPSLSPVQPLNEAHAQALNALRAALTLAMSSSISSATPAKIDWPEAYATKLAAGDSTPLVEAAIELLSSTPTAAHINLALRLGEQAANMNDERATALLAVAAANGWGQPRDTAKARSLLQGLQEQGYARAYCLQAELDARLPGGAQQRRVRALLAEGAQLGDAACLNAHAAALEQEGHAEAARTAYEQAAAKGHAAASANLARLKTLADEAAQRRHESAAQLPTLANVLQAAERGDAQAQFDLARRLHRGVQAPHDLAAAFYWYSQAAQHLSAAREVFSLIVSQSPGLVNGELDVQTLQSLSQLPVVMSIEPATHMAALSAPRFVQAPLRDASLLAGLERSERPARKPLAAKTSTPQTSLVATPSSVDTADMLSLKAR
jgi:TPR repeat protein